uniref:Uncharacterized protein n=1 Tax=Arundo donax TaxID=35708 RepID=A0A0A9B7I4_ARUDO
MCCYYTSPLYQVQLWLRPVNFAKINPTPQIKVCIVGSAFG